jgi:hypothetical protein
MGDQLIDEMTGECLHIINKTEGLSGINRGYDMMIGNISSLTDYNSSKKNKYILYVPLKFTCCKFYSAAMPLISMIHTNINIKVKLKKLSDVAYWTPNTIFNKKPKLKCGIIASYIILEQDERYRIATSRHEQLIELFKYNGDVTISSRDIKNNPIDIPVIFSGMSKEIYIVCRLQSNIDGSLPNGEKKYNNYLINGFDPIEKMQIKFNGCERETLKDGLYYSCLNKLTYNSASHDDGIYVYSFSLYPELLQPSGAANLSKFNKVEFIIYFNDKVLNIINENNDSIKIGIYNKSYNLLRIMSGMAGLAYFS